MLNNAKGIKQCFGPDGAALPPIDWSEPIEFRRLDPPTWVPAATCVVDGRRYVVVPDGDAEAEGAAVAIQVDDAGDLVMVRPARRRGRVRNVVTPMESLEDVFDEVFRAVMPGIFSSIPPAAAPAVKSPEIRLPHVEQIGPGTVVIRNGHAGEVWLIVESVCEARGLTRYRVEGWNAVGEGLSTWIGANGCRLAKVTEIASSALPANLIAEPVRTAVIRERERRAYAASGLDEEGHRATPHEPVKGVRLWQAIGFTRDNDCRFIDVDGVPAERKVFADGQVFHLVYPHPPADKLEPNSLGTFMHTSELRTERDRVRAEREQEAAKHSLLVTPAGRVAHLWAASGDICVVYAEVCEQILLLDLGDGSVCSTFAVFPEASREPNSRPVPAAAGANIDARIARIARETLANADVERVGKPAPTLPAVPGCRHGVPMNERCHACRSRPPENGEVAR